MKDRKHTRSKLCLLRVALMFLLKRLVLATTTDDAIVGNHAPHGRRRALQAHLPTGHIRHDNQLPEIDGNLN